jgi:dipeptidyl aminopeptidase/acylaminoacyl peptidase
MKKFIRICLGCMALLDIALELPGVSAAQPPLVNPTGQRAATAEDSVRLRTFVEENPVSVSPDGHRVAYVLTEPDLKKNYDETVLYVREIPASGEEDQPRAAGKALLRTRGIRRAQWLAGGQQLLVLHHPDGGKGIVVRVDLASGESSPASPGDLDVEEFAATPDGRRLALLVNVPDQEQADRFASPRGVLINEDDFLLDIDARGAAKKPASRTSVVAADVGGGAVTVYGGERSLALMRPAISADGRHITFHALGEALPYPTNWQKDPAFRQWSGRGFVVPQNELLRAELPATISSTPASAPKETTPSLGFALDAGCVSDQFWSMAALWSDDSSAYLLCGPSPVGDGSAMNEPLVGPYRPHHLFAIDAKTGAARRVMEETPRELLAYDEQARRIVLMARNGDLVTLRRTDTVNAAWKEEQRTKLPASGLASLSAAPGDTGRFVGLRQTTTEPPDLWLLDAKTGHKTALTEINPELREQTLGRVEKIAWAGANGVRNSGYLIYPVGHQQRARYPCVILCKSWDETFIHGGNDGLRSNFAPQALANCGFVVLMLKDSAGSYANGTWKDLPGGISEAFRGMDAFETARRELDRLGLIDPARVGIMGFSRSSWIVDFTLTHSSETWAAAVSADSGIYNYGTYLGDKSLRSGMAAMYGGPPRGETLQAWLDYAPAFSAQNVRTPLLMQYHGKISMAAEFYSALITQGKPVELAFFPDGKHILDLPLQRAGSMQRIRGLVPILAPRLRESASPISRPIHAMEGATGAARVERKAHCGRQRSRRGVSREAEKRRKSLIRQSVQQQLSHTNCASDLIFNHLRHS